MRRRNKQTNDETTDGSLLSATTALVSLNTCCSLTHLLKHLRPSSHLQSLYVYSELALCSAL